MRAGEYYDGRLYSLLLSPEWRASAYLRLSADLQLDRLEFPARDERVWSPLARLRVLASASPRLSFSAVLQANGVADLATANLRLRYSVREGHDLWVVYNHDQNLDRDRGRDSAFRAPRARACWSSTPGASADDARHSSRLEPAVARPAAAPTGARRRHAVSLGCTNCHPERSEGLA